MSNWKSVDGIRIIGVAIHNLVMSWSHHEPLHSDQIRLCSALVSAQSEPFRYVCFSFRTFSTRGCVCCRTCRVRDRHYSRAGPPFLGFGCRVARLQPRAVLHLRRPHLLCALAAVSITYTMTSDI